MNSHANVIYVCICNTYGIQNQDNMGFLLIVQARKWILGHKFVAQLFGMGAAGIVR